MQSKVVWSRHVTTEQEVLQGSFDLENWSRLPVSVSGDGGIIYIYI